MATDTGSRKKPADHATELKDLIIGYAKQETVDPLRSLGRYLGLGLAGAILVGIGSVLMLLALLRGLQSWDALDGDGAMSLIPYGATFVAAIVIVVLAGLRIAKEESR